ncbi:MAG: Xaa-Pro peptidase family protein [Tannerellaceae bacterium]|jgi:Xaa-Pro aminopeptidase|nr:Xaa-Pro peptidase family protein [Tannerellaceae bacterium]
MIENELAGDLKSKWKCLQKTMQKDGADGCLLATAANLFYMTGRLYNGYFFLPPAGEPWFFVKRPAGLSGDHVSYIRKPEEITDILKANGVGQADKLLLEGGELPYNDYMRLLSVFNPRHTADATAVLRAQRMVKTAWEIEQLRISARRHALTYAAIPGCYRPGMTDLDLQYEIERIMRRNGSLGVFRTFGSNMDIFQGSVLAGDNAGAPSPFDFALGGKGINASLPIGADGTALEKGMAVMVDMAGNYTAYLTDMTRTFSVGELPGAAYDAHKVSIDIVREIESVARPGMSCAHIYEIAGSRVARHGLEDCFMGGIQKARFVGHGIGIEINEPPVMTPRSRDVLEEGMTFALEPKFVIPGVGAVGVEDSFLVTRAGLEKLTYAEEEIISLI